MREDYHPELDDSPLLSDEMASKYRAVIGSANWVVLLGRFDIAYATNVLARFSMNPREGHLIAAKRIFGYLEKYPKGEIIMDPNNVDHADKLKKFQEYDNWQEFYPDAVEEIPTDIPEPGNNKADITVYVDADHAHDQVTRRSVTGIVLLVNGTIVKWITKRQKTVETSTYGSEMVAARLATEMIMEYRYLLRTLGIRINGPSMMLGDNNSVILNTTLPSSMLKKKHNAVSYHRVREAIAARIIMFVHIPSEENLADVLTKPLPGVVFHRLIRPWLFKRSGYQYRDPKEEELKTVTQSNAKDIGIPMESETEDPIQDKDTDRIAS